MLTVRLPPGLNEARRYIVDVVLGEFLGLPFQIAGHAPPGAVRIEAQGRCLEVADVFFAEEQKRWLQHGPRVPAPHAWNARAELAELRLLESDLPVAFAAAHGSEVLVRSGERIHVAVDIFGTAFFLLTRYEEALCEARDRHGRVPLRALASFQRENLHRPLVDEYVEVLWALLVRLWPGLQRRTRPWRMVVTHDVDAPFSYAFLSGRRLLRRLAGDLLRRGSPRLAMRTAHDWWSVKAGDLARDPYNRFDWMMAESERRGLTSAFYFICSDKRDPVDGDYPLEHPLIGALMQRIAARGHEIGLHGSYHSGDNGRLLRDELGRLREQCERHGIRQPAWGGRQHYLRWQTPGTIRHWNDAGLAYDSTLGFPERPGFRCGTCHEFPAFDLASQQPLRVRERPLIVMECSVVDPAYMDLGEGAAALDAMLSLKRTCRRFGGDFVLLWHNSYLVTATQRELYQGVLDG